jgi:hypothetical protein
MAYDAIFATVAVDHCPFLLTGTDAPLPFCRPALSDTGTNWAPTRARPASREGRATSGRGRYWQMCRTAARGTPRHAGERDDLPVTALEGLDAAYGCDGDRIIKGPGQRGTGDHPSCLPPARATASSGSPVTPTTSSSTASRYRLPVQTAPCQRNAGARAMTPRSDRDHGDGGTASFPIRVGRCSVVGRTASPSHSSRSAPTRLAVVVLQTSDGAAHETQRAYRRFAFPD